MARFTSAGIGLVMITGCLSLVLSLPTSDKFNCILSVPQGDNKNLEYNLCPLLERKQYRVSREVETPPSRTKINYDINLRENLAWDGTLPFRDQCEVGTKICMTVISERPDHRLEPPRTIYVVPVAGDIQGRGLNMTFKLGSQVGQTSHAPLELTFHGGLYMGIPQEAIFTFNCDPTAKEPSEPVLTSHADPLEDQGKHKLSWTSHYACPVGGYPEPPSPDKLPPSPPPPVDIPERVASSHVLVMRLVIVPAAVAGIFFAFKRSKQRDAQHPSNQYHSLALSHLTSTLYHEADPRSPLSPDSPDSARARSYSSM